MFFNKKLIAAVASVVMAISSFSAFTIASAAGDETSALPTVTVDYITTGMVDSDANCGVKFTLSNINEERPLCTFGFKIDVPINILKNSSKQAVTTYAKFKRVVKSSGDNFTDATMNGAFATSSFGDQFKKVKLSFAGAEEEWFVSGDSVELDFYFDAGTVLPVGSFTVTDVQLGDDPNTNVFKTDEFVLVNNAEVKAATGDDVPVVEVTGGAVSGDFQAIETADAVTATGDDDETDKSAGFAATLTTDSTTSYSNIMWKVTDGTETKYRKFNIGTQGAAGGGEIKVGLIVGGIGDANLSAGVAFVAE